MNVSCYGYIISSGHLKSVMLTVREDSEFISKHIDTTKQYKLEICGCIDSLIIYKN